jgi:hypothetical protein
MRKVAAFVMRISRVPSYRGSARVSRSPYDRRRGRLGMAKPHFRHGGRSGVSLAFARPCHHPPGGEALPGDQLFGQFD